LIIKENEDLKKGRDKQRVLEKEEDAKMLEQLRKAGEEEDLKRERLWKERENRITKAMNRMADTVIKKQEEQDKIIEIKVK
jgi:hypothetical protein